MRSSRYSTLLRILLALVALAGILYWAADTRDRFELGLHLDRLARDPFKMNFDTRRVSSFEPEAEQARVWSKARLSIRSTAHPTQDRHSGPRL